LFGLAVQPANERIYFVDDGKNPAQAVPLSPKFPQENVRLRAT
jgi:hypothetical protein